ncbi:hypothetical protein IFR05_005102 [Cadophora sp. M221]|nr:hypothetical protein IFR05_005102 [Cadophora sp. M221]
MGNNTPLRAEWAFHMSDSELTREQNAHRHNFCESCFDQEQDEHDYGSEPPSPHKKGRQMPQKGRTKTKYEATEGAPLSDKQNTTAMPKEAKREEPKPKNKEPRMPASAWKKSRGEGCEDTSESEREHDDDYFVGDEDPPEYRWNNSSKKPAWFKKGRKD